MEPEALKLSMIGKKTSFLPVAGLALVPGWMLAD